MTTILFAYEMSVIDYGIVAGLFLVGLGCLVLLAREWGKE